MSSPQHRKGHSDGSVRRLIGKARWELRTAAGRHPRIYLPALRRRYRPGQFQIPLRRDTELVIDGMLRSGTTFAFTAFEHAQPRKVRVAHHVHAPGHVIAAARQGTPTLVLIREPEESVLSLVVRLPHLSLRQALRSYAGFYEPLLAYRSSMVVGTFQQATTDLGGLIRRVNRRFGTSFAEFEHTDRAVEAVMALIDQGDRREFGTGIEFERAVGRPSLVRQRMKDDLRTEYRAPALHRPRRRAERVYLEFTRDAAASPDPHHPGSS